MFETTLEKNGIMLKSNPIIEVSIVIFTAKKR